MHKQFDVRAGMQIGLIKKISGFVRQALFSLIESRFNGWMVCFVWLFFWCLFCSLAGRSCWCAHTVFDCQVWAIIQLDNVLFFLCSSSCMFLVHRLVVFFVLFCRMFCILTRSWQVALPDVL